MFADSSTSEAKDLENLDDIDIETDVFSDDSSMNELRQHGEIDHIEAESKERYEKAKAIWSQLSEKTPKELIKKLEGNSNVSPVGDLQRWVDGHFGSQSPVDFPRELTPPRTPVEDMTMNGSVSPKPKELMHLRPTAAHLQNGKFVFA